MEMICTLTFTSSPQNTRIEVSQSAPQLRRHVTVTQRRIAFHLSGLIGRKELVLASLNGKAQDARVHFSRHNSPNSRALADRSGRAERL